MTQEFKTGVQVYEIYSRIRIVNSLRALSIASKGLELKGTSGIEVWIDNYNPER